MSNELTFVLPNSDEWIRMWGEVGKLQPRGWEGNTACLHADCQEYWQYMGTLWGVHEFRHRCHPATNSRMVITVPAGT